MLAIKARISLHYPFNYFKETQQVSDVRIERDAISPLRWRFASGYDSNFNPCFFQVDISNQEQMSSFKHRLQSLPSVAGIVHTAMVLRDEFIKDLTFSSFTEVMGPKIKGAILLAM